MAQRLASFSLVASHPFIVGPLSVVQIRSTRVLNKEAPAPGNYDLIPGYQLGTPTKCK